MAKRSIGFALDDVAEETRAAGNLRRELRRWFPSSDWVALLECPRVREAARLDRRAFIWSIAAGGTLLVPTLGCSAEVEKGAGVVFEAIKVAAAQYVSGGESGGSAFYSSDSPSRENAALQTQLLQISSNEVQDENEEMVPVPAKTEGWAYAYEGLISALTGDHRISGTSVGITLLTQVFAFL
jgi:hypothetical protein